jgi:hypothetical protein
MIAAGGAINAPPVRVFRLHNKEDSMGPEQSALQKDTRRRHDIARRTWTDPSIVTELINLLSRHPQGLRRWSVMRALRSERERHARDVPQKFEDAIERAFRRFCADQPESKTRGMNAADALFFRPLEKAGEVWAVYPDRAKAWLSGDRKEIAEVAQPAAEISDG